MKGVYRNREKIVVPNNKGILLLALSALHILYSLYWLLFQISNFTLWWLSNEYFYASVSLIILLLKHGSQVLWIFSVLKEGISETMSSFVFFLASAFMLLFIAFVFTLFMLLGNGFSTVETFTHPQLIELGTFLLLDILVIMHLAERFRENEYVPCLLYTSPSPRD
eukprot:TRINITY_DN9031_c0_g1_i1.p1 TRINITY_DN9031_c0_g1~~TRINITY_DN9031_c0_g1_i1.p1  ORF type:complete len:166 (-),score=34.53 TRINITY_DN9031_c0_g1_i1:57-554(-)